MSNLYQRPYKERTVHFPHGYVAKKGRFPYYGEHVQWGVYYDEGCFAAIAVFSTLTECRYWVRTQTKGR